MKVLTKWWTSEKPHWAEIRRMVRPVCKRATGRLGVDCAVETSGNEQALQQALRGLAYGAP